MNIPQYKDRSLDELITIISLQEKRIKNQARTIAEYQDKTKYLEERINDLILFGKLFKENHEN